MICWSSSYSPFNCPEVKFSPRNLNDISQYMKEFSIPEDEDKNRNFEISGLKASVYVNSSCYQLDRKCV